MTKLRFLRAAAFAAILLAFPILASAQQWPAVTQQCRPGTRWWWMGSSVDSINLTRNLETYAKAGIGAVEITPIYGVVGNEKNDIDFLSPRWMQMLGHTEAEGARLGIEIDMNTGTGWPFGGPEVTVEEAATRVYFKVWHTGEPMPELNEKEKKNFPVLQHIYTYTNPASVAAQKAELAKHPYPWWQRKVLARPIDSLHVALYVAKTRQAVKRAAPGGEGYVMDHLNPKAVRHYLDRFDQAFASSGVPYPSTFFNDSYEVYEADWTPALLDEFKARRGYDLADYLPSFIDDSLSQYSPGKPHDQVIADYRETISDLLLEVFTATWRDWAHSHGAIVRNQAHGSPANLLDVYASVDIPEIEGFGLSDFGIDGLRKDTLTKKNDSDLSMLKYPASVAHFYGKPYVSSETFTWLTEHFRTSLSQCKPDFDLMMVAGVNHCYFHGTTYSPKEAAWPGHLFYASMEMSPINTIWRDAPAFMEYMTRVQSWMQSGQPDNDLLVYLPVLDIWHEYPGRLLQFDIHSMAKKAPGFIRAVNTIYEAGYDMDYCSDRMIAAIQGVASNGSLIAPSGIRYKALVLPEVKRLPEQTRERLEQLRAQGATIITVDDPTGYVSALRKYPSIVPEELTSRYGLKSIRRRNATGYHYFISCLQPQSVTGWVRLATPANGAYLFNPLTTEVKPAPVRHVDNHAEVYLDLASGESCILQTVVGTIVGAEPAVVQSSWPIHVIDLKSYPWQLSPVAFDSWNPVAAVSLPKLAPWTQLGSEWQTGKGTACYSTVINLSKKQIKETKRWILDLGDVRESAHLYINGQDAGVLFCAPFSLDVTRYLKKGKNQINIEVTGLAANYVAEMDRRNIKWRIFKNANIANLKGGAVSYYGNWDIMPGGLNSSVTLKGY